ncbi:MAG: bifunctional non-ous end joining protein LigD [Chloroflexota bacterium]|jgi:bifunctional non-homologous end joining protein LigD|nr:bifunctional non-ous end joining protein LigD [Chloroflexota bacterium]
MAGAIEVDVAGRRLKLSNLEKVFYPGSGFTKAQVIDYYTRIAPVLLPHMKGRPLTLKRYPNGVDDKFFYEKNCPKHRPEWVQTAAIYSRHNKDNIDFCVVDDVPTLVWAANLASIELHTSLARATDIQRPTMLVFDLDPGAPATIKECCAVGLRVRDMFAELGLQSFPKTSGSKGLQVYIPLNTAVTYEATKPFALLIAQHLEQETPRTVTSNMKKELRHGKVFVDWSQNDDHKTTVCVYSMRARERPTVSTPVTWDEVEAHARGKLKELAFVTDEVLARVDKHGDLFAPLNKTKQKLPTL